MLVQCDNCKRTYDDASRWTICPHGPLGYPPDAYCPKCDIVKGGPHPPCEHLEPDNETKIALK